MARKLQEEKEHNQKLEEEKAKYRQSEMTLREENSAITLAKDKSLLEVF
jgi:hypothetical protein